MELDQCRGLSGRQKKKQLKKKWKKHLNNWQDCKETIKALGQQAATSATSIMFCFDMMKVLPVPKVELNLVYYLRQPWLFTTGVHKILFNKEGQVINDGDNVHLYTWLEGQAKKGSVEIGNVLGSFIRHEKDRMPGLTTVTSASDRYYFQFIV